MPTQRFSTSILPVIFWMGGTLLSFSVMAVSVRQLSFKFALMEILTIRNVSGVIILSCMAFMRPSLRAQIKTTRLGLHALRNAVHFLATYLWALSLTLLPMATVFALEFTAPAWVSIMAVLFLGERLTTARIAAVVLGFVGVLVIIQPGVETFQASTLIVLTAAICFSISIVSQKLLTKSDSTFGILFIMNASQLPLALIGVFISGDIGFLAKLEMSDLLPFVGICFVGLTGHMCLTNAFRAGDAIVVVPLDFLRIPLIAFVGYFLYGERLDPVVFFGSAFIISGILWNILAERRYHKQLFNNG
jgi:drug/metabolite transporter (DMT)-like permease